MTAHRASAPAFVTFAVITVSDTRSTATDKSGPLAREILESEGHRVAIQRIVRDEAAEIERALRDALEAPEVQAIVFTGGTGVAPRDVTPETLERNFDKRLEGFGEAFRRLSFEEIGTAAILSRATAGVVARKAVFALPGSSGAVRLGVSRLIAPEIAHLVSLL